MTIFSKNHIFLVKDYTRASRDHLDFQMLQVQQRMENKNETLHPKVKSYASFKSKLISHSMNKKLDFS